MVGSQDRDFLCGVVVVLTCVTELSDVCGCVSGWCWKWLDDEQN